MRKTCRFISDNTPSNEPNILTVTQREDGDIEILVTARHHQERGVSIRASGSRLKNYGKIIALFSQIIDLINEDPKYMEADNDKI